MEHEARFPRLVAETLSGNHLVLPDALDGDYALVLLVFRRHAQSIVDSWTHPVARRYGNAKRLSWYEVPMLAGGWRMVSGFIDGGMRAGIPPHLHDNVATYYGDSSRFRDALEIHDLDSAYGYLIDDRGMVLWSDSGWAHQRRLDRLTTTLDRLLAAPADTQ